MTQTTIAPGIAQELSVNADVALAFLEMAASGRGQEALDRYGGLEFRHHNPYFAGDGEALVAAMDQDAQTHPGKRLEVVRIISEGPNVAIHSKVTGSTDHDLATVHIFRIEDGKIMELWDVAQEAPADSRTQVRLRRGPRSSELMRLSSVGVASLALLAALAGCQPSASPTSPGPSSPVPSAPGASASAESTPGESAAGFVLTSSAFAEGEAIPGDP